ncbi:ABC transporter (Adp1) [Micractinium conductrix]|uniref:ABC transporter (Adp1) n=1 Tax=Micractinium conductrix TaxID=554055 RepID=A0A2P6VRV5_9CHLO|nr:ABC transporter (Adp1) [Micractinium conductrix]|eukprot:PSC76823.1 ABC transporter (Adp1) [Micractinium conductrix]
MGASGAGKTLLLDVLAGQAPYSCDVRGSIKLEGTPLTKELVREHVAFVQQFDVLLPTATVREAVTTCALLRLPLAMPRADKAARVESILAQLDLLGCGDKLIGEPDGGRDRLSGGQRRRTSLACELVSLPRLILLDEPLSGLDSHMALSVVQGLSRLAQHGCIVLLSVHQASSMLERHFHQVMLLAQGRLVVAGSFDQALQCFEVAGYSRPLHASPADFLVTCVKTAGDAELAALHNTYCALQAGWEAAGGGQASPPKHGSKESYGSLGSLGGSRGGTPTNTCACVADGGGCAACHAACAGHRPTGSSASASASASLKDSVSEQSGTDVESGTSSPELPATPELRVAAAPPTRRTAAAAAAAQLFMLQTWVLLVRHWRSTTRRRTALALDVAQKLFSAVFLGLIYFQVSDSLYQGTLDRMAALCLAAITIPVQRLFGAAMRVSAELPLLRAEQKTASYPVSAWVLARVLAELPFAFLNNLGAAVVGYFMIGMQPSRFFVFFLAFHLLFQASDAFGQLLRAVMPDMRSAQSVVEVSVMLLFVTTGFMIYRLPPYMAWLQWVSYAAYGYHAMVINEFTGLVLIRPSGTPVTLLTPQSADVQTLIGDRGLKPPVGVAASCAMMAGQALLGYALLGAVLAIKARLRRL